MYQVPFEFDELTYDQALERLHSALRFGICPMLETVEDMLAELADPDLCYDCVQIAGTNGKTSTSRFTAAALAGEGLRVALYTSPELVSYTERMEVAGAPVSEAAFARGIAAACEAGRRVNGRRTKAGERPYDITEFDTLTVAAAVVFAEAGVDVAVLECGMGGRWDATSAFKSIKAVAVTGIGLDHIHVLGDTLEKIAGEKAAIIKPGRACVLGVGVATPTSVEDVFLNQCAEAGVTPTLVRALDRADVRGEMHEGIARKHADLPHASFGVTHRPERLGARLELSLQTPRALYSELSALKPDYQAANLACAVTLAEAYLGRALNEDALFDSLVTCPTPGRFQLLSPDPVVLIDACHNPQSVQAFLAAVRSFAPDVASRPQLLCAILADKDVAGIVGLLAREFPAVAVTQTSSPRALEAEELAGLFRDAGANVVGTYSDVRSAVDGLAGRSYVACGSITLAGEVAALWR
jgi:dihydrofolate synthase / folylpolyglutamate synthase